MYLCVRSDLVASAGAVGVTTIGPQAQYAYCCCLPIRCLLQSALIAAKMPLILTYSARDFVPHVGHRPVQIRLVSASPFLAHRSAYVNYIDRCLLVGHDAVLFAFRYERRIERESSKDTSIWEQVRKIRPTRSYACGIVCFEDESRQQPLCKRQSTYVSNYFQDYRP